MNNLTGHHIRGEQHIRQSIEDILTTPVGARVMRRDYGSLIYELLDRPINDALLLQVYAATFIALRRWEPRVRVEAIAANNYGSSLILNIGILRLDTPSQERTTVAVTVGRTL